MKNTYIAPALRQIDLDAEQMIATSQIKDGGIMSLHEETVDTQLSNEKDLWGNEDIWK